jgi:hypothetical protein
VGGGGGAVRAWAGGALGLGLVGRGAPRLASGGLGGGVALRRPLREPLLVDGLEEELVD